MLATFHREYVEGLTATMIEEALAAERLEERQVVQIYHWVRELALRIRSGVCSDSTAAPPDQLREAAPGHVLHHDKADVPIAAGVDHRDDIGMIQRRGRPRLAQTVRRAPDPPLCARRHLDRDRSITRDVNAARGGRRQRPPLVAQGSDASVGARMRAGAVNGIDAA